ncbi:MAG: menaquinol-cytochrome c reductase cytochrome b subunit [Actinomycetia bacterium]|nr:menaquinol-cytochrome c reductase cytochrome b subunit [Actinomycetes bacterium]
MAQLPDSLLRRSAEARAKAEGRPVDEILAEMKGEAPPAPAPPAAASSQPSDAGGGRDLAAESGTYGVPVPLLERSMFARAKADGTPVPAMAGVGAPAAAASAVSSQPSAAPAPQAPSGPPPGVRTQRLLTVVKAGAIQGTEKEPQDKVNVWPHLLAIEFVALLVVLAALTLLSAFVDAPLLEFANFNEQPNPSKAPWYFLGLQELLAYFDPMVAGIIIPTFGMIALAFIPYVDRNPSVRPSDRKFAIAVFTVFFMAAAVVTIFGSFFRGPGFNFVFPWRDGIFFDDLLTILE